jgi:hypothetical protein
VGERYKKRCLAAQVCSANSLCGIFKFSEILGRFGEFFKVPCNFDCKLAFKRLMSHVEEMLEIIGLDFDIAGQLLIIYSFVEYLRKM